MFVIRRRMRRVSEVVAMNPGFHRFVIQIGECQPHFTGHLINPDAEPELRDLLSRVMVLSPPTPDDDPYAL